MNPFLLIPYLLLQADHEKVEYCIVQFLSGIKDAVLQHALVDDTAIFVLETAGIFHAVLVVAAGQSLDQGVWQRHTIAGRDELIKGRVHLDGRLAHLRSPLSTS